MDNRQHSWEINPYLIFEQRVLLDEWYRKGRAYLGYSVREATPEFLEEMEALYTADNIKEFRGKKWISQKSSAKKLGRCHGIGKA